MLIRFAVENYNSFKGQQIFSMAAGKQTRHATHCFTVNGKRLLKSSFFFGANASGKSNFVRALDFMRRVTLMGIKTMRYNDRFFRIDPAYKEKPGVFQIDFIVEKTIFSYGFAIDYLTHEFCAEWLYRLDSSETETCIFEREQGHQIRTDLRMDKNAKLRFEVYSEDLKSDELFLNEVGNKKIDENSGLHDFIAAYVNHTDADNDYESGFYYFKAHADEFETLTEEELSSIFPCRFRYYTVNWAIGGTTGAGDLYEYDADGNTKQLGSFGTDDSYRTREEINPNWPEINGSWRIEDGKLIRTITSGNQEKCYIVKSLDRDGYYLLCFESATGEVNAVMMIVLYDENNMPLYEFTENLTSFIYFISFLFPIAKPILIPAIERDFENV